VVVEASDYEEAVAFYRDVLGGAEELVVDWGATTASRVIRGVNN
jgi:hypothetical protein